MKSKIDVDCILTSGRFNQPMAFIFYFVLIVIIVAVCAIPRFIKNWKILFIWTLFVSAFVIFLMIISVHPSAGDAPAAAGGMLIIAGLLLVLNTIFSGFRATKIYTENGGTLRQLPTYLGAGVLGVFGVIFIAIFTVGVSLLILASFFT